MIDWASRAMGWVVNDRGCHIWQGWCSDNGYARVTYKQRKWLVHRLRYEDEIGPIPLDMELDHYVCDNGRGACCNPHHCRPVSRRENNLRSGNIGSVNRAKTHCLHGHELDDSNVVVSAALRGERKCRACSYARARAQRRARCYARSLYPLGTAMYEAVRQAAYSDFCRQERELRKAVRV